MIVFTPHADLRLRDRGISEFEVRMVLENPKEVIHTSKDYNEKAPASGKLLKALPLFRRLLSTYPASVSSLLELRNV